jgi:hypothetical protein
MGKKDKPTPIHEEGKPTVGLDQLSWDDLLSIYNVVRKQRGLPEKLTLNHSRAYLIRRIETYYNRLRSGK